MHKFFFGQTVKVTEKYIRKSIIKPMKNDYGQEFRPTWKVWERIPYTAERCLFLGTRTLKNGVRDFDHEYGYSFQPKEHFQAALVSPGMKENPIFVPFDCVEEGL